MVQLTKHNDFGQRTKKGADPYWKIDCGKRWNKTRLIHALQDINFRAEGTATQRRLRELYIRSQRGLVSYEFMDLPELKLYIAQRGLPAFDQKTEVSSFKRQLEQADDETRFRFLDLPPELRVQIYTHYFKSFVGTRANIQTQPPITGACQLVRQESLPVFYSTCKFRLDIKNVSIIRRLLDCTPQADNFLQLTTADHFGLIRTIDIVFHFPSVSVELFIDLGNSTTPVEIRRPHGGPVGTWMKRSLLELHTHVVSILSRQSDLKLRKTDLERLHEIVRSNLTGDRYQT